MGHVQFHYCTAAKKLQPSVMCISFHCMSCVLFAYFEGGLDCMSCDIVVVFFSAENRVSGSSYKLLKPPWCIGCFVSRKTNKALSIATYSRWCCPVGPVVYYTVSLFSVLSVVMSPAARLVR